MLDKQRNLAAKIHDINDKPAQNITQEDASELKSKQVSFMNRCWLEDGTDSGGAGSCSWYRRQNSWQSGC